MLRPHCVNLKKFLFAKISMSFSKRYWFGSIKPCKYSNIEKVLTERKFPLSFAWTAATCLNNNNQYFRAHIWSCQALASLAIYATCAYKKQRLSLGVNCIYSCTYSQLFIIINNFNERNLYLLYENHFPRNHVGWVPWKEQNRKS